MINFEVYSPALAQHAAVLPPGKLFHYTSPEALIGIVSNKEMWATNTMFLNDASEAKHAIDLAASIIRGRKERGEVSAKNLEFVDALTQWIASAAPRSYVISFTELSDSLSQWRAYCPPSGGYAIGLPAAQLRDMAASQDFMLVKCVYDYRMQQIIINEILDGFIKGFERRLLHGDTPERTKNFALVCRDYLVQVALLMKHSSFQEEQEWRLISSGVDEMSHNGISFRGSPKGIIPFFKFKLTSTEYPDLVARDGDNLVVFVGPSPDRDNRQIALQFLLSHHFGYGAYHGASSIPYKTW
ncbi:MAG: DUF2971 domain-containing protein [Janthinobacterium lividum]